MPNGFNFRPQVCPDSGWRKAFLCASKPTSNPCPPSSLAHSPGHLVGGPALHTPTHPPPIPRTTVSLLLILSQMLPPPPPRRDPNESASFIASLGLPPPGQPTSPSCARSLPLPPPGSFPTGKCSSRSPGRRASSVLQSWRLFLFSLPAGTTFRMPAPGPQGPLPGWRTAAEDTF